MNNNILYEQKLRESISNKSSNVKNDLLKYFNNSESTNIEGKEENFINFVLDKRENLNLNLRDSNYFYNITKKIFLEIKDNYKDLDNEFSSFNRMYSKVKLKRLDNIDFSCLTKWINKKEKL